MRCGCYNCHPLGVELISLLTDTWPIALSLRWKETYDIDRYLLPFEALQTAETEENEPVSPDMKILVDNETKETLSAFVEFVLHDTAHPTSFHTVEESF